MSLVPVPVYQHDAIPSTNNSFRNLLLNIELFNSLRQTQLGVEEYVLSKQVKESKTVKEYRKRTKHPELWKMNIKKNARLRSEEYIGAGGNIVPAKTMGPP
ncbi:uncharacterized protein [Bombus fervidus]|uniref:uncharacterized protein n=1 Tax=Bombus fervidus TaxID=203811 RepID=UPI003AB363B3